MISFDEYREIYHDKTTSDYEIKHLESEFNEQLKSLEKLDIKKWDYTKEQLVSILFDKPVNSQTTFYRTRRGLMRLATIRGFDFRLVHKIGTIEFEDVFNNDDFSSEYFGSLDELCEEVLRVQKVSPENDRTGSLAVVCLLWSGLTFAELTRLRDEDVDVHNRTVKAVDANGNEKQFEIDERTAKAISSYMSSRKCSNGFVFVGRNGEQAHRTTINKMLVRMNNYSNKKFVSKNITYSGWFWRIYHGYDEELFATKDVKIKYDTWINTFAK
jgi:integrase